jgi:hypothetical protein
MRRAIWFAPIQISRRGFQRRSRSADTCPQSHSSHPKVDGHPFVPIDQHLNLRFHRSKMLRIDMVPMGPSPRAWRRALKESGCGHVCETIAGRYHRSAYATGHLRAALRCRHLTASIRRRHTDVTSPNIHTRMSATEQTAEIFKLKCCDPLRLSPVSGVSINAASSIQATNNPAGKTRNLGRRCPEAGVGASARPGERNPSKKASQADNPAQVGWVISPGLQPPE